MEELNSIIGEMIANGEPQEVMDAVITEWEQRNPGVLTSNTLSTSEEPKIEPEVPTWLENTFGNDTFGVDFVSDMYRAWNSGWRQASAMG